MTPEERAAAYDALLAALDRIPAEIDAAIRDAVDAETEACAAVIARWDREWALGGLDGEPPDCCTKARHAVLVAAQHEIRQRAVARRAKPDAPENVRDVPPKGG